MEFWEPREVVRTASENQLVNYLEMIQIKQHYWERKRRREG